MGATAQRCTYQFITASSDTAKVVDTTILIMPETPLGNISWNLTAFFVYVVAVTYRYSGSHTLGLGFYLSFHHFRQIRRGNPVFFIFIINYADVNQSYCSQPTHTLELLGENISEEYFWSYEINAVFLYC